MTSSFNPLARVVFSPERAQILRQLVYVTVVVDLYFVAVTVIEASTGNLGTAIGIGLPTGILVGYTVACLVTLRPRTQLAKVLCVMTGSLLVIMGLVLTRTVFGIVPVVLGLAILVLSLRRDSGER